MAEHSKEDLAAFQAAARAFSQHHPDYDSVVSVPAHPQGAELEKQIVRMHRPDLAYHVLGKEPQLGHALLGKSEARTRDALELIAKDIDTKGTYRRPVPRNNPTDEYLEKRGAFRGRRK